MTTLPQLVSKQEALALGLKRYFTGIPCKPAGHVAERWTSSGACYDCVRARNLDHSRIHKERFNAQSVKWNADNKERRKVIYDRWLEPNKERELKRKRTWTTQRYHEQYKLDPEHRERAKAVTKEWAEQNHDRMLAHSRASKARNREAVNAKARARYLANQEKERARAAKQNADRQQAVGRFTAEDILTLLEQQGYRCAAPHCRIDVLRDFHCDHILPLSRGGTNWPDNIQILCPACNLSKNDRTMEEWLAVRAVDAERARTVRPYRIDEADVSPVVQTTLL